MIYPNKRELIKHLIHAGDTVLDVGFSGQGIKEGSDHWPHAIIKSITSPSLVYGLDISLPEEYRNNPRYLESSAEDFHFDARFDAIFAGDLVEHLSNPGLFLHRCKVHLKKDGVLILTTPNTFNLFNIAEKLTKYEPTVNPDHTFYFNSKTLKKLLEKNGMKAAEVSFVYSLEYAHAESWKKKFLNMIYSVLSRFTDKFVETLVVVAKTEQI